MTVVNANLPGHGGLAVVCDSCAVSMTGPLSVRRNWQQLWERARQDGWQGPNHPMGPHRCAGCAGAWTRVAR